MPVRLPAQYWIGAGFGSSGVLRTLVIESSGFTRSYLTPGKMMIDAVVPEPVLGLGLAAFVGAKERSMPIFSVPLGFTGAPTQHLPLH